MSNTLTIEPASNAAPTATAQDLRPRGALGAGLHAVVNQVVFSLGNFATAVLIGRFAGASQLGSYSLALSFILLASAVQRALVAAPYTVQAQRLSGRRRNLRRGSALVLAAAVGVVVCVVLAALASLFWHTAPGAEVTAWVLAWAAASWGMRDFCRRILFADHRFGESVIFDAVAVVLQIAGLSALAVAGGLSAAAALWVMAASSGAVTLGWLWLRRAEFAIHRRRLGLHWGESWRFGRWAALSEATFAGQECAVQGVLAVGGGFAITGIYAAASSIVRLINPLVLALHNFVGPYSAKSLSRMGIPGLAAGVRRITWLMTAVMLAYLAVMAGGGGWALRHVYGSQYAGNYAVLMMLALAAAAAAVGMPPSKAISALEKPQLNLLANAAGLIVTVGLAIATFSHHALYGVAAAVLTGATTATVAKWVLYRYAANVRTAESSVPAARRESVREHHTPRGS